MENQRKFCALFEKIQTFPGLFENTLRHAHGVVLAVQIIKTRSNTRFRRKR